RERLKWTGPAHVVPNGTTVAEPGVAPGPAGDPDLVCVTRLVPHKRLDLLLDLAQRLAERRPGLRLHIVGDGPDAPALAAAVAERGLGGVVVAHGYVPEETKAALVARADLHLSTSQGEGWGLSRATRPRSGCSRRGPTRRSGRSGACSCSAACGTARRCRTATV